MSCASPTWPCAAPLGVPRCPWSSSLTPASEAAAVTLESWQTGMSEIEQHLTLFWPFNQEDTAAITKMRASEEFGRLSAQRRVRQQSMTLEQLRCSSGQSWNLKDTSDSGNYLFNLNLVKCGRNYADTDTSLLMNTSQGIFLSLSISCLFLVLTLMQLFAEDFGILPGPKHDPRIQPLTLVGVDRLDGLRPKLSRMQTNSMN